MSTRQEKNKGRAIGRVITGRTRKNAGMEQKKERQREYK